MVPGGSAAGPVLHIGAPKTGSTALQAFLSANREALRRQGWSYPDVCLRGYGHHDLAFLSGGGYPEWATPQSRSLAELVEELRVAAAGPERLIISSENFYLLAQPAATAKMLASAGIAIDSVKVVVYVRRQDEAHMSWYNQVVKAQGFTGTIDDCIALNRGMWDYDANVKTWAKVFGAHNLVVRPYVSDDLSRWDVRRAFLEIVGINEQGLEWQQQPVNTRINRDLLEVQRWVNRLPLSPQNKRRFHKQLMALTSESGSRAVFNDSPMLDPDRRLQLLAEYSKGNASVASEYLQMDRLFEEGMPAHVPCAIGKNPLALKKLAYIVQWFAKSSLGVR